MATPFTPRLTPSYGDDDPDWYDTMLGDLRDIWHTMDGNHPLYGKTKGERATGRFAVRQALVQFIYRFEPALATLEAPDALWMAERFADRFLDGTPVPDLDYEAGQHFGPPEIRTVWPPKAAEALAETDIDPAIAERYGLSAAQANQIRRRLGIPTKPEPQHIDPDPDW